MQQITKTEKIRAYNRKWSSENREKRHISARKSYLKNWGKRIVNSRKYYKNNREKLLALYREQYIKNPEKKKLYSKEYSKNNRDKVNVYARQWSKINRLKIATYRRNYRAININARLANNLRSRFYKAIITLLIPKKGHLKDLIGTSISNLRQHLEQQFQPDMSWENYGQNGWVIDHIIPLASFDLTKLSEQKKAFHYTNLQPLWATLNFKKNDRLISYPFHVQRKVELINK